MGLTPQQLETLAYDWRFWGREDQLEPPPIGPSGTPWLTWLILAGRGFGKTRTGAETIRKWATGKTPLAPGQCSRIAIVAETSADARDVLVEGESGILSCHPKDFRPRYEPSKRRLTWPNGAVATTYNATEPDQLRGPQHDAGWCDELAKWAYAEDTWDQLQFGMRLGDRPRKIITTTPRPIPVLKRILALPTTVVTKGSTFDNIANLAESYITEITARYQGTRLGRQELDAELLDDTPGALWTRQLIEQANQMRVDMRGIVPALQRVVVAVDPSGARDINDENADSQGIVIAGKGVDGRAYVLSDWTCKLSPHGWGSRAVQAYRHFAADRIVAERNFGGAMVEHTVRTVDSRIPYREVNASRNKVVRAEPVAALYEQGRVVHLGDPTLDRPGVGTGLESLEDQMCQLTHHGFMGEGSPDRVDALVWALTDLMLEAERPRLAFG
jgi:phage terminase large subunit-like protein